MGEKISYTKENLEKLCKESSSYNDVLIKSGRTKAGNNHKTLKKYIELFNIDTSHFESKTDPRKNKEWIEKRDSQKILTKTKICQQCGLEKDTLKDYYWSNNKTRSICKDCVKANEKERYKQIKEQFNEYKKTLSCEKCGEKRFYLLEFHHKDPNEKDYNISDKTRSKFEDIKEEISKCDVLCANCHREFHYLYQHNFINSYEEWKQKEIKYDSE